MAYNRLLTYIAIVTILTAIVNIASFYKLSCLVSKISIAERNLLFVSGSLFLVQLAADLNTVRCQNAIGSYRNLADRKPNLCERQ